MAEPSTNEHLCNVYVNVGYFSEELHEQLSQKFLSGRGRLHRWSLRSKHSPRRPQPRSQAPPPHESKFVPTTHGLRDNFRKSTRRRTAHPSRRRHYFPDVPRSPLHASTVSTKSLPPPAAEPVKRKIAPFKNHRRPGGYNGFLPRPHHSSRTRRTASRIIVENALPEKHFHATGTASKFPSSKDGVPFISQKTNRAPGRKPTLTNSPSTRKALFFYHAHSAMQEMIGLPRSSFIAHPQNSYSPHADHDYAIVLQEWAISPVPTTVPNTALHGIQLGLPSTASPLPPPRPLIARSRQPRCVLRFVNLGMDHHPIHPPRATNSSSPAPKAAALSPESTLVSNQHRF